MDLQKIAFLMATFLKITQKNNMKETVFTAKF